MKVLLHNSSARAFYAGSHAWVPDDARAMNFSDVEEALRLNLEAQLGATEILFIYENPRRTLVLPITSTPSPARRRKLIPSITCIP